MPPPPSAMPPAQSIGVVEGPSRALSEKKASAEKVLDSSHERSDRDIMSKIEANSRRAHWLRWRVSRALIGTGGVVFVLTLGVLLPLSSLELIPGKEFQSSPPITSSPYHRTSPALHIPSHVLSSPSPARPFPCHPQSISLSPTYPSISHPSPPLLFLR